ncbi:hypothetical protein ACTXT7_001068 [Hymenolepis weldensis]
MSDNLLLQTANLVIKKSLPNFNPQAKQGKCMSYEASKAQANGLWSVNIVKSLPSSRCQKCRMANSSLPKVLSGISFGFDFLEKNVENSLADVSYKTIFMEFFHPCLIK